MNTADQLHAFHHNLLRQLRYIQAWLHRNLNARLDHSGYAGVRRAFIEVIPYLSEGGTRLADLRAQQTLPATTLSRLINTIYQQGYIEKRRCAHDARSTRLFITPRGLALVRDAHRFTLALEEQLIQGIGEANFRLFCQGVDQFFAALDLYYPPVHVWSPYRPEAESHCAADADTRHFPGKLLAQLTAIDRQFELRLSDQYRRHDFADLSKADQMLLLHLHGDGVRAKDIAMQEQVSKQSISDISHRLHENGYIRSIADPEDKRAQRLVFSARGLAWVALHVRAAAAIEAQLQQRLGDQCAERLQQQCQRLCAVLGKPDEDAMQAFGFANLDAQVDGWLQSLLQSVSDADAASVHDIFQASAGGYRLRREFLDYLAGRVVAMQRQTRSLSSPVKTQDIDCEKEQRRAEGEQGDPLEGG